ncbi:unnamed protein product [Oncorhynchus mykiss]|uniref:Uncharacterized protein n=1 Tax=Oncorhynchus mykiss TaxID=8022 RepID=A0A060ZRD6_ONCMY|nr:unnamed protein product [Oncorhynchus mykiss]
MCDAASRRKPWSKVTSRGLRMQLWLNCDLGQNTHIEPAHNQAEGTPSQTSASCSPAPESPLSSAEESSYGLGGDRDPLASQAPSLDPPYGEPSGGESQPGTPLLGPITGLSIQETIAMSPELDTYVLTKKVKEVLTDNNLGETQTFYCSSPSSSCPYSLSLDLFSYLSFFYFPSGLTLKPFKPVIPSLSPSPLV